MKELIKQSDLKKAIKYLVIAFLLTFVINVTASAQEFKFDNNVYESVSKHGHTDLEHTVYKDKAKDGTLYDIWIKADGRCYTKRVSKKTGKEYLSPVKEPIARDVCKRMNRKYTYVKQERK